MKTRFICTSKTEIVGTDYNFSLRCNEHCKADESQIIRWQHAVSVLSQKFTLLSFMYLYVSLCTLQVLHAYETNKSLRCFCFGLFVFLLLLGKIAKFKTKPKQIRFKLNASLCQRWKI